MTLEASRQMTPDSPLSDSDSFTEFVFLIDYLKDSDKLGVEKATEKLQECNSLVRKYYRYIVGIDLSAVYSLDSEEDFSRLEADFNEGPQSWLYKYRFKNES